MISQISHVETIFWLPPPTISDLMLTLATYSGTVWGVTLATYSGTAELLFLALAVLSLFTYRKVRGAIDWKAPLKALKDYAWEVSFTKDYNALYFLAVWLLAINVIPFVISFVSTPIYITRYLIAGSVALYLIVAKVITNINYRYAKLAVVIVVVALAAANLQAYYTTPTNAQSREAVGFVNENAKSGDLVLIYPGADPYVWDYYYRFVACAGVMRFPATLGSASITELQSDINGHNRVWLVEQTLPAVQNDSFDPQVLNQAIQTLNTSYKATYHESYYGYEVYLFEKRA
jgi:hypothetical protein